MSIKVQAKFLLYKYFAKKSHMNLDETNAMTLSEYIAKTFMKKSKETQEALIDSVKERLNALLTWEFEGETSVDVDEGDHDIYILRREGTSEAQFKQLVKDFNQNEYCLLDDKEALFGDGFIHLDIFSDDEEDEADAGADPNTTCFFALGLFDKDITKHLARDPKNFILQLVNGNNECESLTSLRKMSKVANTRRYNTFYECSKALIELVKLRKHTPTGFGPKDFITDREYVKVGSSGFFIEKPVWMFEGTPPEPRIFKLEKIGRKFLVEKEIAEYEGDVVSGVHCDLLDEFDIHRLVPVDLSEGARASASEGPRASEGPSASEGPIASGGKKNKKNTKRRKIIKKKKTLKKKNKKYTKKKTTRKN